MLTFVGRWHPQGPRRAAQLDGLADERLPAMAGRLDRTRNTQVTHLRIGKDLVDAIDRAAGNSGAVEQIDPFRRGLRPRDFLDRAIELISIGRPSTSVSECRIR